MLVQSTYVFLSASDREQRCYVVDTLEAERQFRDNNCNSRLWA